MKLHMEDEVLTGPQNPLLKGIELIDVNVFFKNQQNSNKLNVYPFFFM